MSKREELKAIRPAIPTITQQNETTEAEQFQNTCLRPILKLQNDLLIALFKSYILSRKGKFHQLSDTAKAAYIADNIKKDLKFKNLLIGAVLGHFTMEEYQRYQSNSQELNRRISSMLIKRLQDQIDSFAIVLK